MIIHIHLLDYYLPRFLFVALCAPCWLKIAVLRGEPMSKFSVKTLNKKIEENSFEGGTYAEIFS